jgi:hypothetical protein
MRLRQRLKLSRKKRTTTRSTPPRPETLSAEALATVVPEGLKYDEQHITYAANAEFEEATGIAYTVEVYTMDVNGNYGAAETKTVPATTGAAVSVTPDAREGFTVADNSVLSGIVAADSRLVLKVYYSRNQYKLTVDGVESMVYYGAALEIADPAPREGYTFTGWNPAVPAREQGENNAFAQYGSFVHSLLERWGKDELAEYELLGEYEDKFFDRVTQEFPPNKYTDLSKKYYDDGVQFFVKLRGRGCERDTRCRRTLRGANCGGGRKR